MIRIVDYGLGNILAFQNVYKRLNMEVGIAREAGDLNDATRIILPGVGAFDRAMQLLDESGMRATLDELVLERRVPVLGVCVGMQILARSSDEGERRGLEWVRGHVKGFASRQQRLPLPHMGWNDVVPREGSALFGELGQGTRFYFLHSYYFECDSSDDVAAVANYGGDFGCAVSSGNVHGVQFHPEKSHHYGKQLLKNFALL